MITPLVGHTRTFPEETRTIEREERGADDGEEEKRRPEVQTR